MVEVRDGKIAKIGQNILCRLKGSIAVAQKFENVLVERTSQRACHPDQYILLAIFIEVADVNGTRERTERS